MALKSFTLKDGKAFIDANDTGWIRKDDMLYRLMQLKEMREEQWKCYNKEDDLEHYKHMEGMVDMLMFLIKELKEEL